METLRPYSEGSSMEIDEFSEKECEEKKRPKSETWRIKEYGGIRTARETS